MAPRGPHVFAFASPCEALAALLGQVQPVPTEGIPWTAADRRILAQPIVADRDSPSCDVSAMDGYAVRLADLSRGTLPVAGEAGIGRPASRLPAQRAMRIFTGAPIPEGAELVVRREDVAEEPDRVRVSGAFGPGENLRRQGENAKQGEGIVEPGRLVDPAVMTAAACFGVVRLEVFRRVRVGSIVTGDELRPVAQRVEPWELRDSNGPALRALRAGRPWLADGGAERVPDQLGAITDALARRLERSDAVFLTGGVSMGDHDHVPDAVRAVGGRIVFHGLPIRPGKPLLAALGPAGQPILGLPGNPVSVLTTARRFGLPVLARRAGLAAAEPARPAVEIANPDDKSLDLWWYRPVRLTEDGQACLLPNRGSGDVAAAARSDGFVEIPPGRCGAGPWSFLPWW